MMVWIVGIVLAILAVVVFCGNYVSGKADKRLEHIMSLSFDKKDISNGLK